MRSYKTLENSSSDLTEAVSRYESAAKATNKREMKRFVKNARKVFEPEDWWEEFEVPKLEPCDYEASLAYRILRTAFQRDDYSKKLAPTFGGPVLLSGPDPVLCYTDPDTFHEGIEGPLFPPLSPADRAKVLAELREALLAQAQSQSSTPITDIELPSEFVELQELTNGIYGAGVPSENDYFELVYRSTGRGKVICDEALTDVRRWFRPPGADQRYRSGDYYEFLAAFCLGGEGNFGIMTHYAYCRPYAKDPITGRHLEEPAQGDFSWRVLQTGVEQTESFEDLKTYIDAWTRIIEDDSNGGPPVTLLSSLH